jgi:methyl-accepting chemotaxis protein
MGINKKMNLNIRAKLLVGTIPVLILAFIVIGVIFLKDSSRLVLDQQNQFYDSYIDQLATDFDDWLNERVREATILSKDKQIKDALKGINVGLAQELLTQYKGQSPIYENIFLADTEGEVHMLATGSLGNGINLSKIPAYRINVEKASAGQSWIGSVNLSPESGRPVILITAPVMDAGRFIGIVGTPIELNYYSEKKSKV